MTLLQLLTAVTPVIAVLVLLVLLRLPATRARPMSLLLTALTAYFSWGVGLRQLAALIPEGHSHSGGCRFCGRPRRQGRSDY